MKSWGVIALFILSSSVLFANSTQTTKSTYLCSAKCLLFFKQDDRSTAFSFGLYRLPPVKVDPSVTSNTQVKMLTAKSVGDVVDAYANTCAAIAKKGISSSMVRSINVWAGGYLPQKDVGAGIAFEGLKLFSDPSEVNKYVKEISIQEICSPE